MFDVGFSELVILFVIGLLILGPERLPRVASQLGRWLGRARRTANQLRMQLEREMALNDITKPPKKKGPPSKGSEVDKPEADTAQNDTDSAAEPPDGESAQTESEVDETEHTIHADGEDETSSKEP